MAKPLYGFLERAHVAENSFYRAFLGLAMALACAGAAAPSPTLTGGGGDYLLLPTIELERVGGEKNPILVGDSIVFKFPGMAQPDQQASKGLALAPTEPGGSSAETTSNTDWKFSLSDEGAEKRLELIALHPGKKEVPALLFMNAEGKPIARTLPQTFEVQSAIASSDPKPQEAVPARPPLGIEFPRWAMIVLGLLILVLLGAGIFAYKKYLKRNRREKAVVAPPVPEVSDDEKALRALSELEGRRLAAQAKFKEHYFGVSEIIKEYVGARYYFEAAESTTFEMLEQLRSRRKASEPEIRRLEELFYRLDRVKFTDYLPEGGEPQSVLLEAKSFVETTRIVRVS